MIYEENKVEVSSGVAPATLIRQPTLCDITWTVVIINLARQLNDNDNDNKGQREFIEWIYSGDYKTNTNDDMWWTRVLCIWFLRKIREPYHKSHGLQVRSKLSTRRLTRGIYSHLAAVNSRKINKTNGG